MRYCSQQNVPVIVAMLKHWQEQNCFVIMHMYFYTCGDLFCVFLSGTLFMYFML